MTNKPANSIPQLSLTRSDGARSGRGTWRRTKSIVRWSATIAIVGWLLRSTKWDAVHVALKTASYGWLFAAAGAYLVSQFASVARWRLLVEAAGVVRSLPVLLSAYFEGMFINLGLPTTVGGDLLKVLRVGGAQHKRMVATSVVADRCSGLVALLALLAMGLDFKILHLPGAVMWSIAVLIPIVALAAARFAPDVLKVILSVAPRFPAIHRVRTLMPRTVQQLVLQSPWERVIAWAFVVQGLNVAAVAIAAHAIGLEVPLQTILVSATTVSLAAVMPISFAGVGVREASLPILLAADGVPREMAITLGLVWSAIVLSIGLLGGPVHFLAQRREHAAQASLAITQSAVSQPAAKRAA